MKELPILFSTDMVKALLAGRKTQTRRMKEYPVGSVLWVKETFATFEGAVGSGYIYRADDTHTIPIELCTPDRWKSSRFMPRKAARIFLQVTDVRQERLQDITEEDAIAEGSRGVGKLCTRADACFCSVCSFYAYSKKNLCFRAYWSKLNAKRAGGIYAWEQNPLVYVHTFKNITEEYKSESH